MEKKTPQQLEAEEFEKLDALETDSFTVPLEPGYAYELLSKIFKDGVQPWHVFPEQAACYESDQDFIEIQRGRAASRELRAICDGCVVKEECADFAIKTSQRRGIWGGYTHKEIRALRKEYLQEQEDPAA